VRDVGDEELVRLAGRGDAAALDLLFRRHRSRVWNLCFRVVGDADAADDLTQESFLRVARYGAGFDGRSSVTSWLYRLVRNRCLDHEGARGRERAGREEWAVAARWADEERREETVASETASDHEARCALVAEALSRLKPEMREVLVLSRFEGMKYREIAELCDLSVANVKVRAHRAMKELRRAFLDVERGHEV
jgi:RNA polymerase sigma-70 factor (ECF subfamily)